MAKIYNETGEKILFKNDQSRHSESLEFEVVSPSGRHYIKIEGKDLELTLDHIEEEPKTEE